ncbi:MAG: winged helix-turn-helix domain-containing protein [Burkholderiales bacterium]|nr:winged helix-turn-helix domain-containing protein [Burkholderiales bacterium]
MRILLIEDDRMVGRALEAGLAQDGHAADWVQSAAAAAAAWLAPAADSAPYDAVIVDLGLPDGSGLDLIRRARARKVRSIVLVVTARGSIAERIAGLNAGADDYMVKPIDLDELEARLRAIDRREQGQTGEVRTYGALSIDALAKTVTLQGTPVALTAQEFAILLALSRRAGAIVSRERIEQTLYSWNEASDSNTIEVQIHRLRRKLGAATIETHRGQGYRLVAPVP